MSKKPTKEDVDRLVAKAELDGLKVARVKLSEGELEKIRARVSQGEEPIAVLRDLGLLPRHH